MKLRTERLCWSEGRQSVVMMTNSCVADSGREAPAVVEVVLEIEGLAQHRGLLVFQMKHELL